MLHALPLPLSLVFKVVAFMSLLGVLIQRS
jgi:hypothetical protein